MLFDNKAVSIAAGTVLFGLIVIVINIFLDKPAQDKVTGQEHVFEAGDSSSKNRIIRTNINTIGVKTGQSDFKLLEKHMAEQIEELRTQIEQLSQKNERLTEILQAQTTSSVTIEPLQNEGLSLSIEEEYQRNKMVEQEEVDILNLAMESEEIDTSWKSEVQERVYEALNGEDFGGLDLLEIDCRSTICRIDVASDGSELARENLQKMTMSVLWNGAGFVTQEGEQVIVYLAREGEPLPEIGVIH